MALEAATFLDSLVTTNPVAGDPIAEGDDHIRLLKTVLKNTFPGLTAAINIAPTGTPQFAGINIGHASDTTLARASAGNLSVKGNLLYRVGGIDVSVADGGTGSSTEAGARNALDVPGRTGAETITGQWTFSTAAVFMGGFSDVGASSGKRFTPANAWSLDSSASATSGVSHHRFYNPNGNVGAIATSGTSTSFNTTSDADLKDAIIDADRAVAIDQIKAGRPVEFEFRAERGVKHLGFIAQEMVAVFPDAVTAPEREGDPWMIDHSKLVPVLWATVQDLLARVEVLESKVA